MSAGHPDTPVCNDSVCILIFKSLAGYITLIKTLCSQLRTLSETADILLAVGGLKPVAGPIAWVFGGLQRGIAEY
jgi:hypothetical protein